MKACKPRAINIQTIPDRLRRRAFCSFFKAFQASNAADNHQHKVLPSVLDIVVPNRKAFLEEIFLHYVDVSFHVIDSLRWE